MKNKDSSQKDKILKRLSDIEEELDSAHWEDFSYTADVVRELVEEIRREVEK